MFKEVPAELVIDKPHPTNNFMWIWSVCQPDACWGEYESGACHDRDTAQRRGLEALARIHSTQKV